METAKRTVKRRMPAEWERQYAVQLTWPHKDTDWCNMLPEITAVYEQIAREISKREKLIVVGTKGAELPSNINYQLSIIHSNDTWARDHGFITVFEEDCSPLTIRLLDFKFNGWGEKFPAELDNQINRQLFPQLTTHHSLSTIYEPHLDFVLEGGSIESDGQGTIFTTTSCLLAPHRNQPLTQAEIEERLKEWLGAERVVWLEHGSLIGDDTDGHIDTLARICPNDTILYTGADSDHPDLVEMEKELEALRTTDGKPYRLLRLPLPRPIYDGEDRLPATYANYLVINGAVLYPTYGQPDLDDEARDTIHQAYPDREMVGIDCQPVIRQHGSLHCCTMQYY